MGGDASVLLGLRGVLADQWKDLPGRGEQGGIRAVGVRFGDGRGNAGLGGICSSHVAEPAMGCVISTCADIQIQGT